MEFELQAIRFWLRYLDEKELEQKYFTNRSKK